MLVFLVFAGGFESSQGSGASADGMSEETAMEWFIECVASYDPSSSGTTAGTCEIQV